MTSSCWQLAQFNLKGQIALGERLGFIRICHADDGTLMLVGKDNPVAPTPENPVAIQAAGLDSILGFVMDIGIARTKWLTGGNDYYWGQSLRPVQSTREVSQEDFSEETFAWMAEVVNVNFQSADTKKATEAIRCQQLIDTYNDGRLMYPNFHSETYLSMLRIIEACFNRSGRYNFALAAAQLSLDLNQQIVTSIDAVAAYKARSDIARAKFAALLADSNLKAHHKDMREFDDATQVVFACFLSAYVYRNKFMHAGFPIPASVKEAFGEDGAGTRYLPASTGLMWTRMLRADGIKEDDLVDLHDLIDPKDLQDLKDTYAHVLPTWYFLRTFAREAILKKLEALSGTSRQ